MEKYLNNICSAIFISRDTMVNAKFPAIKIMIVILLLLLLTGCFSNRQNVSVEISHNFWKDKVYADIACINDDEYRQYEMCSKEEFWEIDSGLRNNLYSKSFIFNMSNVVYQELSSDDPIWKNWKNDDYLIVFVELPESYINLPWKIIIPLEYYSWFNFWDSRETFIYISDKGVLRLDGLIANNEGRYISQSDMKKLIDYEGDR